MRAEFVIVGGGVYGCATAWNLARRNHDVVIVEARAVASGASGGEGERGVRANGRDARELPLMPPAYHAWAQMADVLDAAIGYRRIGHLELIERTVDLEPAAARIELQRAHGIPTRFLDSRDVQRIEPAVTDSVVGAVYCAQDGVVDHTATTQALARAARLHGARVLENTPVTRLVITDERVTKVFTTAEEIVVERALLVVCNAGTPELLGSAGLTVPVVPVVPQVIVTERVPTLVHHLIGHAHRRLALKALTDGRIMITGGWLGTWDPQTGRGRVVEEQVAGNLAEAVAVFPFLNGIPVARAVADRVEMIAPDMVPIIDRIPGTSNALVATGWSGHGWAIAPAVSELLAEWTLTGDRPSALSPFALDRFSPS